MVDNLTFDDGEPITNNKLQSLYNAIKTLEGDIAKTSVVNSTTQVKYTPIVWAGRSALINIPKAGSSVPAEITFEGFQTDNVHVVITPYRSSAETNGSVNYVVSKVSKSGATIQISNTDSNYNGRQTYFDFIAVEMKQSS